MSSTTAPLDWTPSDRQLERLAWRRARSRRRTTIALTSTLVVFGIAAIVIVSAPGWDRVQATFFNWDEAKSSLPEILRGFRTTIEMFLIAEVCILVVGLIVAFVRVVPAPGLAPVKLIAIIYTDVARGTPTLLVVYLVGFGLPALQLQGLPTSLFMLGIIALTFSYGGYVAEVMRAGIQSVHPSQWSSGRSLGLSYGQTLRHVVLPQAIRRVLPPLINDFASLQKDTALVASIGVFEAFRAAQVETARDFNYTPMVVAAIGFILLTVPIARLTDWLALRAVRREQGASA
ncbi:MAG TPA: amino acid ABC transporter permease [Nocardioidaceae bacterium]|nr:amino acid ABC transporter permease [Nocardioidaceae bacterium]